ncbi:hypothetical protein Sjap_009778 [Stephania japonica]|uniref:Uncharacterized protein n=1 Tax=Stephania japonica TaxID=461633 RepID=A0AAP0J8B3_9MAGN
MASVEVEKDLIDELKVVMNRLWEVLSDIVYHGQELVLLLIGPGHHQYNPDAHFFGLRDLEGGVGVGVGGEGDVNADEAGLQLEDLDPPLAEVEPVEAVEGVVEDGEAPCS